MGEASKHQARSELQESEAARLQLERSLAQLRGETQQLLCSYHLQQQRACQLDGTMRQHLQLLDREVSDLCSLREAIAAAEVPMSNTPFSESLETLLFSSPVGSASKGGPMSPI